MSFHHGEGVFFLNRVVKSENFLIFGIKSGGDCGLRGVLVGKNGNAAFEAFGRLGESGIVAIAVEDQVKIIGAVVPGFYVPAFCGFAPFGKNRGHFGFQLFSAFDLLR